jgi:hypothetical protein
VSTTYKREQWIESFEGQLAILRPHLTPRVLAAMSLSAWHKHGRKNEEPIAAAKAWSAALNGAPVPPAAPTRGK